MGHLAGVRRHGGRHRWEQRFAVLDALLLDRASSSDAGEKGGIRGELVQAWGQIRRSRGAVRVDDLAADVGWSRAHLTRRFTDEFGIGPKHAARVERFQRARLSVTEGRRLADIAAACGYADQAHLTRDFQDLGGCTPTQWQRETVTFVQDEVDPH